MAIKLSFVNASKYLYTTSSQANQVNSLQSSEYVGQAVCKAGMTTGNTCGVIRKPVFK